MAQVESIDYNAKRIYLHQDTMIDGFDAILAYFEINVLRSQNANNEQNRRHPYIGAEGKIKKTSTTYTPRFAYISSGWRFVPYSGATHRLALTCEIVSEDILTDSDVFDFSSLSVNVHISKEYEQVEIQTVATGGALTPEQDSQLMSLPTAEEILNYEATCK